MSKLVVDFPFGLEDLGDLFDVVDFLENREALIEKFRPEVEKYLVKSTFFTGPFRKAYQDAFDDLIVRLIKSQIIEHFPKMTPEEILVLCDKQFLKMITQDYYFNPNNYTKEGKNEPPNSI